MKPARGIPSRPLSIPEFELIGRYFSAPRHTRPDVVLGVGDDAAVLRLPESQEVITAVVAEVEDQDAGKQSPPGELARQALRDGLDQLRACGARPAWFTLALTLPDSRPEWLEPFANTLGEEATQAGVQLVGGDTTRGPLTITLHLYGTRARGVESNLSD